VHFIIIKPVFSDHLFYVTLFQCFPGRSHKTGLTCTKWPPVLCDHISMFPWKVTQDRLDLYLVTTCLMWPYFNVPLESHTRQAWPVFSDHLSYVTLFQCSPGRSNKTGLTACSNEFSNYSFWTENVNKLRMI
jgi:hypothetical protein